MRQIFYSSFVLFKNVILVILQNIVLLDDLESVKLSVAICDFNYWVIFTLYRKLAA